MFSWVQNPLCRKIFNANGLGCSSPAATPFHFPLHILYPMRLLPDRHPAPRNTYGTMALSSEMT